MGFWDSLGKAAKGAASSAMKAVEDVNRYKAEFESYDDSSLIRIAKGGGDFTKKSAALSILNSRGYTPEQIKNS